MLVCCALFPAGGTPLVRAGETVRVGVFTLFSPRSVSIGTPEPGAYDLAADGRTLARWTGGPRAGEIVISLEADGRLMLRVPGATRRADIPAGGRLCLVRDGVRGLPCRATVGVPGRIRRAYEGVVSVLAVEGTLVPVVVEPLERYVAEVVAAEMDAGVPPEALKAQSVVSRSYARWFLGRASHGGYDFCDTTHCQFHAGVPGGSRGAAAISAAAATTGLCLTADGAVVPGFCTACCAGMTALPGTVWSDALPAGWYAAVPCPHPAGARFAVWSRHVPAAALAGIFRASADDCAVVETAAGGYAGSVRIGSERMSGEEFRLRIGRRLGWNVVPGLSFRLEPEAGGLRVEGRGAGHGVGLCQAGAADLAARGATFRGILAHYFPALSVSPPP